MKTITVLFSLACLCASVNAQGRNAPPPPDRLVVVGDSLSAGVQNFSLLGTQQPNGYASVIAKQAGWPLTLPLVPYPGAPSVLEVVSLGPPIDIAPVDATLTAPRENPFLQPTNIAVPGLTVSSALSLRPSLSATTAEQQWATIVLGFPSLYQGKAPTEIELALSLQPKILIEWLGNNDALVPALAGQISALTPIPKFLIAYDQILDELSTTGAKLITATIPDVTEIAYFTSVQTIAAKAGLPLGTVTSLLGVGPNDYIRPDAQKDVDGILSGVEHGPLPADCKPSLPDLGVNTLPCVLTQADAQIVKNTVDAYNLIIVAETLAHRGVVVDVHALVDQIHSKGYALPNVTLTTDFFGGLFSLDGIHPTNTGYAVIANAFIQTMNGFLGTNIPQANVAAIFATDPLARYVDAELTASSLQK